jgi:nanoRNase/pAp phosphatase (c-di-AMP/oligoRNAs hydrolase)
MLEETDKHYDIVIYHGPCSDGVTALWCAKEYLKDKFEPMQCKAGSDPEGIFDDKKILFVDLCPSINFIINTSKIAKKITIIDHHKSALVMHDSNIETIKKIKNLEIILDMTRSGCQMTWDYFFKDEPRPWFVDYIGDRDLWEWKLPFSKEINAALFESNYLDANNILNLNTLLINPEIKQKKYIANGKIIIKLQKKSLDIGVYKAHKAEFKVNDIIYNIWLGGNIDMSLRSELGNLLCEKKFLDGTEPDFSVVWVYEPKLNEWWISMRGAKKHDLSAIATTFGGGGHFSAAGWTIKGEKTLRDYFTII